MQFYTKSDTLNTSPKNFIIYNVNPEIFLTRETPWVRLLKSVVILKRQNLGFWNLSMIMRQSHVIAVCDSNHCALLCFREIRLFRYFILWLKTLKRSEILKKLFHTFNKQIRPINYVPGQICVFSSFDKQAFWQTLSWQEMEYLWDPWTHKFKISTHIHC